MKNNKAKMFSEIYQYKHFNILQATFWDTKETISKNYESLMKILEENNSKPQNDQQNYGMTPESLTQSYKILNDVTERENYLSFLKYYYFLSEPISLQQLKKNYYNKIFPFYIFTIKIKERPQICDLTIDFVAKKITITYKDKLHSLIKSDDIITVNKKFGTEIILMVKNDPKEKKPNDKSKQKSEFKEIIFEPELSQQIDIIYTLICYLAKNIEDNNFYSILQNDVYRPCGIILRSKILKEHRTKLLGKDDRYAVLGPSMVIIYKNEEMTDIRNVLPIFPFLMRVIFVEKEKKITFKYPSREQSLSFYDSEHFIMWQTALKEIFLQRIISKMDTVELFEVNAIKEKEKIIKEIGLEIECAQEEINAIKNRLDRFTKKIQENEGK